MFDLAVSAHGSTHGRPLTVTEEGGGINPVVLQILQGLGAHRIAGWKRVFRSAFAYR